MFINPIHRFVTLFEQLQEGMSGFSRFYEIITTPDEVDDGTVEIDDFRKHDFLLVWFWFQLWCSAYSHVYGRSVLN
jgi:hypothetical protein